MKYRTKSKNSVELLLDPVQTYLLSVNTELNAIRIHALLTQSLNT